jgi:hypothetical protein
MEGSGHGLISRYHRQMSGRAKENDRNLKTVGGLAEIQTWPLSYTSLKISRFIQLFSHEGRTHTPLSLSLLITELQDVPFIWYLHSPDVNKTTAVHVRKLLNKFREIFIRVVKFRRYDGHSM